MKDLAINDQSIEIGFYEEDVSTVDTAFWQSGSEVNNEVAEFPKVDEENVELFDYDNASILDVLPETASESEEEENNDDETGVKWVDEHYRLLNIFYREMAKEVGVSVKVVRQILGPMKNVSYAVDMPVYGDDEKSLLDSLPDKRLPGPDSITKREELLEKIGRALSLLSPREQEIIRMRFGIGYDTVYTLDDVGRRFDLTRERIRQIENRALEKLRNSELRESLSSFKE